MEHLRHSFVPAVIRLYNSSGDHSICGSLTTLKLIHSLSCLSAGLIIYFAAFVNIFFMYYITLMQYI